MKLYKVMAILLASVLLWSCSDDDAPKQKKNETDEYTKILSHTENNHEISLYNDTGILTNGYQDIFIAIKDVSNDELIEHVNITWQPMMHMMHHGHSAPKSGVHKVMGKDAVYQGYIVFQMPGNDMGESWSLTLSYTVDNHDYEVEIPLDVQLSPDKTVTVFTASDNNKYILALKNPYQAEVKQNDIEATLHQMIDMNTFEVVENYTIGLDPRMPSMGNHSSPNNQDLIFNANKQAYQGKLSLTMTGLWRLNLMLYNTEGTLIKGNAITDDVLSSDLNLEVEF